MKYLIPLILLAYNASCKKAEINNPPANIVTATLKPDMLTYVNNYRLAGCNCGSTYYPPVPALTWNETVANAALAHSTDMAKNSFFDHKGSDGSYENNRLSKLGFSFTASGENIGVIGNPNAPATTSSPQKMVDLWIKSEGHCKTIMEGRFTKTGIAVSYGKYNGSTAEFYTQVFTN